MKDIALLDWVVQGLANVFYEMKTQFGSEESKILTERFSKLSTLVQFEASMEIARDREKMTLEL